MKRLSIAGLIVARNEERNIGEAIQSLSFADRIVVADTGSNDATVEIARKMGAEVCCIPFQGFGASKNEALELCNAEWIFVLDADERVSPELARQIRERIENASDVDAYSVCRLTYFLGRPIKHSGWFPEYVVRLIRKGRGRFSDRLVHESVEVDGKTEKLDGLIHHHSYETLDKYIEKLNLYSRLGAEEMLRKGKKFRLKDLLFRPPAVFLKMFIFKAGFLDGFNGFLLAVLSAFHVFVKYSRLRELSRGITA